MTMFGTRDISPEKSKVLDFIPCRVQNQLALHTHMHHVRLTEMSLLAVPQVGHTHPQSPKDTATVTPLASSSLPGSSNQLHSPEQLLLGHILENAPLTFYFSGGHSGRSTSPSAHPAFLSTYVNHVGPHHSMAPC